jgi:MFS family permease
MIVLTLLVGHVADRYDHRLILLACQFVEAGAAAGLALGTIMGWLNPLAIYALTALVGAARAFEIPTMVAIIPALVPRVLVPAATAWFATANQAGQIVGPVLGGLLYGLGPAVVYGTAIVLWAIGVSFIAMMRMERMPRASEPLTLRSLLGGFLYVRNDRARHVCGVPGRGRRAVSGVRARYPADRAVGARVVARGARGGCGRHVAVVGTPAADAASRAGRILGAVDFWACDYCVCAVRTLGALACGACGSGRRRRG